jgi:ABC-type uncharacterized transport system substrate-binding protein
MQQVRTIACICCFCLLLVAVSVAGVTAAPRATSNLNIDVILTDGRKEYQDVFNSLKDHVSLQSANQITLTPYSANAYRPDYSRKNPQPDLIITIGTAAANAVASTTGTTPVISSFLPESNFKDIWKKYHYPVSGIIIDQPVERFSKLLGIILAKGSKVGIFSNDGDDKYNNIRSLLDNSGLSLVIEKIDNLVTAKDISRLLQSSDLILLLPELSAISPQRAKWLLYMAYRQAKPVIAFSPSYAKAGALAAIYTTPEAIGLQLGKSIIKIAQSSESVAHTVMTLGYINYPEYFSVATNNQVAKHVGIYLIDDKQLEDEIQARMNSNNKGPRHAD